MGFSPNKRRRSARSEAACAGRGKIPSRHSELSRASRLLQRPSPCLPGDYTERLANSFSYLSPQSDHMYRVGRSIVDYNGFSIYGPSYLIEAYIRPEKYCLVWAGCLANHPFNFNFSFLSDG
jgi:hypothetical protein